jgi:hypothetical protein
LPPHRRKAATARDRDQRAGSSRGDPVDRIIGAGRCPAEPAIAVVAVADHRIGGVDRLARQQAGQPCDQEPEGGRDHTVAKAFRQAFSRCQRDPRFVQRRGIAPDDPRNGIARRAQIACQQGTGDGADMIVEAALGEAGGDDQNHGDRAPTVTGQRRDGPADHRRTYDEEHYDGDAKGASP